MTSKAAAAAGEPAFFATAADFRAWLEANHDKVDELSVGYRKKGSGLASMTYREAVDAALCFGWIDGVVHSIDAASYRQRFTPRRKGSIWSAVNIARVAELTRLGLMHPAGLAVFEGRDPAKVNQYSFEQGELRLADGHEAAFRANEQAWAFFESQPPSYRKPATWWVVSAKRQETRDRRLATLIKDSEAGRRIALLAPPGARNKG
ncbi:MAG: YdeI/OmpD-associated family protein [Pseudomonadota bacterium]|nr:YdeI/OmpD-associated family protein [Pseudomonadota bacterium]